MVQKVDFDKKQAECLKLSSFVSVTSGDHVWFVWFMPIVIKNVITIWNRNSLLGLENWILRNSNTKIFFFETPSNP